MLLNYTTKIEAAKTVLEIQAILVKHGASAIMTNYDAQGTVEALLFRVKNPWGEMAIRLPVSVSAVQDIMRRQKVPYRFQNRSQAVRVAWRILKDWIEAQMAILETEMVSMDQIFLPYAVVKDDQTMYQLFRERQGLLTEGKVDAMKGGDVK